MNNNELKYYRIAITNPFIDESKNYLVYAICENNIYYEILTNKRIYVLDNINISREVFKDDFENKKCSLIGTFKQECSEAIISIFLRFSLPAKKEETIKNIYEIENSINTLFYNNKVKKLK